MIIIKTHKYQQWRTTPLFYLNLKTKCESFCNKNWSIEIYLIKKKSEIHLNYNNKNLVTKTTTI